jgi:hypothetical protein
MITLAQLEQEVGRRVGPYWRFFTDRQVPNTAQFSFANFPELRSSMDQDLVTNLWMLRRGETLDGAPVSLDVVDRQRTVDVYDPEQGRVIPDRPWGSIPVPGEWFEFHHLNPAQELRPAVLAGLRRCFFEDLFAAELTSQYGDIDLTYQQPWITNPNQITRVQYGWYKPVGDAPFEATMQQGHVMLRGTSGPYAPANVWVTALRPAGSWVNDADSSTGPTNDHDVLVVDLDYAASAGHIEAWHMFPSRLFEAAAVGNQPTQEMAAREFTRQSLIWGPAGRQREIGFAEVVSVSL